MVYCNPISVLNQPKNDGQIRGVNIVTRNSVTLRTQKPKTGKPTVIRLRTATIRVWESPSGELVIEIEPP